jgi:DUF4097 and DUF4098 domain-containing protein YvlB
MNIIDCNIWYRQTGAALFALLFFGCSPRVEHELNEAIEQTYKIEPSSSMSIHNGNGSIAIHGTNTPELQLRVIKKANSSEQLSSIHINVAPQPDFVSITTNFLQPKNKALFAASGTVDYMVSVPPTIRLRRVDLDNGKLAIDGMRGEEVQANVVDGQLVIRNCFANIHARIANGTLDLLYDHPDQRQFSVDAQITSGNARIVIPRAGSFHVRAETVTGKIINDFAETVEVNGRTLRKIDMSFGKEARSEIKLRVTTGDIRIAESKPGIRNTSRAGSQ